MFIDTHSHLNFRDFDKDRDKVIERALENDVWLINASATFDTSKLAVEIAEKYEKGIYASIGLHPIHVKDEDFDAERYKELARSDKVSAIGETGLDFMYEGREKQEKVFLAHLALAKELNLPVILHCRKAHSEMLDILKSQRDLRGVLHCFSAKWPEAKRYLEMGLYLGFNGIIYKMDLTETIKKTPLNRILIETDCPYLTPPELEGKRNEPLNVRYIAERLAETRGETFEKVAQATTENAKKLFGL